MNVRGWCRRFLIAAYRRLAGILGGTGISQVYPINRLERAFLAWMRSSSVTIEGHLLYLDPTDSLNLSVAGSFESYESELLVQLVKPGAIVADVGANIGFYTLLLARAVGPNGQVHAFEPAPANFALLAHFPQQGDSRASFCASRCSQALVLYRGHFHRGV